MCKFQIQKKSFMTHSNMEPANRGNDSFSFVYCYWSYTWYMQSLVFCSNQPSSETSIVCSRQFLPPFKNETRRSEIEERRRRPDWCCHQEMHCSHESAGWMFGVLNRRERGGHSLLAALLHCTFCSVLNLSLIQFDLYWKIILSALGSR